MIGPVIFDSNVLVDHFNGIEQARHELKLHRDAVISTVTWMELMTAFEAKLRGGIMTDADYAAAKSVLSLFPVVSIDNAIKHNSGVRSTIATRAHESSAELGGLRCANPPYVV